MVDPRSWAEWSAFAWRYSAHLVGTTASRSSTAGDLAQEALVRLWLTAQSGRPIVRPTAWLRTVLLRLTLDEARRPRPPWKHPHPPWSAAECEASDPACEAPWADPEHAAQVAEIRDRAEELLKRLPPPHREIARLQVLRGASRSEIIRWLQRWRPVGEEECRRLLRATHRALRIAQQLVCNFSWRSQSESMER